MEWFARSSTPLEAGCDKNLHLSIIIFERCELPPYLAGSQSALSLKSPLQG